MSFELKLRKALIVLSIAVPSVSLLQIFLRIFAYATNLKEIPLIGITLISGFIGLVQPLAIGALCLFAAHSIRPFRTNSDPSVFGDNHD